MDGSRFQISHLQPFKAFGEKPRNFLLVKNVRLAGLQEKPYLGVDRCFLKFGKNSTQVLLYISFSNKGSY